MPHTYRIMSKHKRGISLGIKWQTKIKNAVLCSHAHMQLRSELTSRYKASSSQPSNPVFPVARRLVARNQRRLRHGNASRQVSVVRQFEREYPAPGKFGADNHPAVFVDADFTEGLRKILESGIGPSAVQLGYDGIAPDARAPAVAKDEIRVERWDRGVYQVSQRQMVVTHAFGVNVSDGHKGGGGGRIFFVCVRVCVAVSFPVSLT